MGKPRNTKSLDGVSTTGPSDGFRVGGHYHLTLAVAAAGLDSANDTLTVALEGSPDGDHWFPVDGVSSDKKIEESDFSQDPTSGDPTASVTVFGSQWEYVRARVVEFTDDAGGDLSLDGWILAGGWEGPGVRSGRET
jgi:hypothetical protein